MAYIYYYKLITIYTVIELHGVVGGVISQKGYVQPTVFRVRGKILKLGLQCAASNIVPHNFAIYVRETICDQ